MNTLLNDIVNVRIFREYTEEPYETYDWKVRWNGKTKLDCVDPEIETTYPRHKLIGYWKEYRKMKLCSIRLIIRNKHKYRRPQSQIAYQETKEN